MPFVLYIRYLHVTNWQSDMLDWWRIVSINPIWRDVCHRRRMSANNKR
jgi:hypothetical protein